MSKVSLFVQQFVAFVKGDDAELTAIKVKKNALIALKSKISALDGTIFDKQNEIEDQKEKCEQAIINYGDSDFNRVKYCENLVKENTKLDVLKEELEGIVKAQEFFKSILVKVDGDDEAGN